MILYQKLYLFQNIIYTNLHSSLDNYGLLASTTTTKKSICFGVLYKIFKASARTIKMLENINNRANWSYVSDKDGMLSEHIRFCKIGWGFEQLAGNWCTVQQNEHIWCWWSCCYIYNQYIVPCISIHPRWIYEQFVLQPGIKMDLAEILILICLISPTFAGG